MSKKLLRQLTLARCIPHRPYKLTASQLQVKLEEEGIHVSLRTVQRDLEEMSGMGLFDLTSDERSKPHGWCFERHGLNDFANIMPLSLAVALKTWSDQASQLLPASVLTELNPLVDKASQVIRDSQSELAERWLESVHQSPRPFAGNPEIRRSTLIRDALWRGRKFSAEILRIPVKLNSDSGICEHHFRKVCGQGFFEQKLSFEGRHLFDSLNKPAAKRSAAVVDPRRWNRTVHLTSEYVH